MSDESHAVGYFSVSAGLVDICSKSWSVITDATVCMCEFMTPARPRDSHLDARGKTSALS